MLLQNMKNVIKYAIELDIDYIESFLGYEGDKVLHIISKHRSVIDLLENYLKNLDLDYKSEYEVNGKYGPTYSLYVGIEDPSNYKLKKSYSY